jgi:carbamoyltransferase
MKNSVLAGGVALNCVGNGAILRDGPFENIWIQPAAGDAGGALGVALFIHASTARQAAQRSRRQPARLAARAEVRGRRSKAYLDKIGAKYHYFEDETKLVDDVADQMAQEKVIGWLQGRMEFGPRALGGRSIIGDARIDQDAVGDEPQDQVPRIVPPVRAGGPAGARARLLPDAPAEPSPYMLLVAPVRRESQDEDSMATTRRCRASRS